MNFYKALIFSMSLMLTINGYAGIDEDNDNNNSNSSGFISYVSKYELFDPRNPLTITTHKAGLAFRWENTLNVSYEFERFDKICDVIKNRNHLKSVQFYGINFSTPTSSKAFIAICGFLCQKNTIEELEIYNAGIGENEIGPLLDFLKPKNITRLQLHGNSISSEGALKIIKCTNIPILELSDNKISSEGAAEIINVWSTQKKPSEASEVSTLNLVGNKVGLQETYNELKNNTTFMNSIKKIIKINRKLKIINADDQEIRVLFGPTARKWMQGQVKCEYDELSCEFNLFNSLGNSIDFDIISIEASKWIGSRNKNQESVELRVANCIFPAFQYFESFCNTISIYNNLTHLILSSCHIDDKLVKCLLPAIYQKEQLKYLCLFNNIIGCQGAFDICNILVSTKYTWDNNSCMSFSCFGNPCLRDNFYKFLKSNKTFVNATKKIKLKPGGIKIINTYDQETRVLLSDSVLLSDE